MLFRSSQWPYQTNDPNPTATERAGQASIAFARMRAGVPREEVAAELGISVATMYRRLEDFARTHDQPSRYLRQVMAEEELAELSLKVRTMLDSDASNADKIGMVKELRMLNQSVRKLYAVDDALPAPIGRDDVSDPQLDEWVAAARAESEATIREVRGA